MKEAPNRGALLGRAVFHLARENQPRLGGVLEFSLAIADIALRLR